MNNVVKDFSKFIDEQITKTTQSLDNLEEIETHRSLHDEELKYKHQLQGSYFTLLDIRYEFHKEIDNDFKEEKEIEL